LSSAKSFVMSLAGFQNSQVRNSGNKYNKLKWLLQTANLIIISGLKIDTASDEINHAEAVDSLIMLILYVDFKDPLLYWN